VVVALAMLAVPFGAMAQQTDPVLPDAIIYPGQRAGLIMVVNKAEQLLFIYRHDGQGNVWLEKILPCSTGMIKGDKLIRGDKKTPEGYYIFNQKLLPSELPDIYGILAYPMDYPNFYDRKIGRGGDGIWAHGINKPLVDYDSEGCIEIQNHDIAALEDEIKLNDTPILVYEQVNFVPKEDLKKEADDVSAFVEDWRKAWSSKNIPAYASHYDDPFYNSDGMNHKAWMDRKTRVAAGYKKIEIDITDLRIYRHRDTVIASFTQDYRGDGRFRSLGFKRLYLKGRVGAWRIIAEEYGPLPGPPPVKWLTAEQKSEALTTPPLAVAQLSEPAASASAGAILPAAPTLVAENKAPEGQTQAQAAADEAARAALEQRSSQNAKASEVTVLASLSAQEEPLPVTRDAGPGSMATPTMVAASSTVTLGIVGSQLIKENQAPPPPAEPAPAEAEIVTEPETAPPEPQEAAATAEPATEPAEPEPAQVAALDAGEPPAAPSALTAEAASELLGAWLRAWSAKDEEAYFSFYAKDFLFKDLNLHLNSFKRYRSRRFQEAGNISVEASDVVVNVSGDQATVTFVQSYKSDRHGDQGLKTLALGARDGQWRIVSESFQATP
jgi:murein L,D-transpeptidase YafK